MHTKAAINQANTPLLRKYTIGRKGKELTQTKKIHKQQPPLQRHKLEIHRLLHQRPHHPIRSQRFPIRSSYSGSRILPLQQRHRAQEHEQIRRGEEGLVCDYARGDGAVSGSEVDVGGEEAEPSCCGGAEDY